MAIVREREREWVRNSGMDCVNCAFGSGCELIFHDENGSGDPVNVGFRIGAIPTQ